MADWTPQRGDEVYVVRRHRHDNGGEKYTTRSNGTVLQVFDDIARVRINSLVKDFLITDLKPRKEKGMEEKLTIDELTKTLAGYAERKLNVQIELMMRDGKIVSDSAPTKP